jgi:hypothetical protein
MKYALPKEARRNGASYAFNSDWRARKQSPTKPPSCGFEESRDSYADIVQTKRLAGFRHKHTRYALMIRDISAVRSIICAR